MIKNQIFYFAFKKLHKCFLTIHVFQWHGCANLWIVHIWIDILDNNIFEILKHLKHAKYYYPGQFLWSFIFYFPISAQEFHIQTVCRRWCHKFIGISFSSSHVLDFWPDCIYFHTCNCNKIYRRLELPGFSLFCIYYSHNYWIWWLSCRYYFFSFFILSKFVHDI